MVNTMSCDQIIKIEVLDFLILDISNTIQTIK